jgi:hypothetical protein
VAIHGHEQRNNFPQAIDGITCVSALFKAQLLGAGHGPGLRVDVTRFFEQTIEAARLTEPGIRAVAARELECTF